MAVMNKRFLLFVGSTYYSSGGWSEFYGDFDDLETAEIEGKKELEGFSGRWFQVVDLLDKKIIFTEGEQF